MAVKLLALRWAGPLILNNRRNEMSVDIEMVRAIISVTLAICIMVLAAADWDRDNTSTTFAMLLFIVMLYVSPWTVAF